MNKLPFEVNSLIFKQLDKKNLNNCLFVNKSFANFIYKLLWNTISLKNVKVLTKLWFEDEEGNKNNFSNVINPNLMFPYNEAVTVIECTYLNTITYDMERIINSCKNVKCIIYQSSVIEKPILKYQRPLYQWELSKLSKLEYLDNQFLLKKIDKEEETNNLNNEWDDRTVTMEDVNNSSFNAEAESSNYSQLTEIEGEMSIVLNSIEQEFEVSNEIIDLSNSNNDGIYPLESNSSMEIEINDTDNNVNTQTSDMNDSDSSQTDQTDINNTTSYSSSLFNSLNNCSWSSINNSPYPILSNIKILDFSNSCISPEVLESFISNCNHLEEIIFLKNDISDKSLQQLMKCSTLKYLHINFEISSWDDDFTYEEFTRFIDFCNERLQKLYIHSIKLLDKDMITYLIKHCPKNIYSIVFDSQYLTSQEVSSFIKQSKKLEELVIGSRFSKSSITKLPFDLNTLYLDDDFIASTPFTPSHSISNSNFNPHYNTIDSNSNELSMNLDSIQTLFNKAKNIQWFRNLTKFEFHFEKMDNGLFDYFVAIIKEMKNLEYLKLSGDVSFTNKNIFDLLFNLRNLKSLQLWIYNSNYNFNNFNNDNKNRETNINNIILSNLKSNLLAVPISHYKRISTYNYNSINNKNKINSKISTIYENLHLLEISSPFAYTSDCLELIATGVCPKLKEISGYFNTDVLPNHLQNTIRNLSFINTIFISNFQFEQNNEINTITKNYQSQWKYFANKYKKPKSLNSSINHFNELNEILISSHRMVLTFNEGFINRFKQIVESN